MKRLLLVLLVLLSAILFSTSCQSYPEERQITGTVTSMDVNDEVAIIHFGKEITLAITLNSSDKVCIGVHRTYFLEATDRGYFMGGEPIYSIIKIKE